MKMMTRATKSGVATSRPRSRTQLGEDEGEHEEETLGLFRDFVSSWLHFFGQAVDSLEPPSLSISETADEVVVHHADRLHVRIHDGRTDEAESAALEILAERVGFS